MMENFLKHFSDLTVALNNRSAWTEFRSTRQLHMIFFSCWCLRSRSSNARNTPVSYRLLGNSQGDMISCYLSISLKARLSPRESTSTQTTYSFRMCQRHSRVQHRKTTQTEELRNALPSFFNATAFALKHIRIIFLSWWRSADCMFKCFHASLVAAIAKTRNFLFLDKKGKL